MTTVYYWCPTHEERAKAQLAITALRAALAQQTEPYRLPDESARSTHSEDCWQWHQACAVAEVERLRKALGGNR